VSIVRDHMVEYIEPQLGRQSRQDVRFSGSFVMLFVRVVHNVMGVVWRERASVEEDCFEVGASNSGILNLGARKASTDQVRCLDAVVGRSNYGVSDATSHMGRACR